MTEQKTGGAIPPREEEEKACRRIFDGILSAIDEEEGYTVNKDLLIRAYERARELHGDQRRKSGVLYLRHPLTAMESLARLHCKSSVLAAALLHDTIEDCDCTYEEIREDFSYEVAEIVKSVTAIKKSEREADRVFRQMTKDEQHDYLDTLTDNKLLNSQYQREAVLVRLADRENNLATLDAVAKEKRRLKIDKTREFLIPAARKYGMRYFEVVLNDYCMKYSGMDDGNGGPAAGGPEDRASDPYQTVKNRRNEIVYQSSGAFSQFEHTLQRGIESQDFFRFATFNPIAKAARTGTLRHGVHIPLGRRRILLPSEIAAQLGKDEFLSRQNAWINEILLTCRAAGEREILSRFIAFCREHLRAEGIIAEYAGKQGTEDDVPAFILTDSVENRYRVVLIPSGREYSYFTGSPDADRLDPGGADSVGDFTRTKMTVYARGKEMLGGERQRIKSYVNAVPQGATALDFAFIVKPALAYTAKAAWIEKYKGDPQMEVDEKGYRFPLSTVLHDGDVVKFDCDYDSEEGFFIEHAQLSWFNIVNTVNAREKLVRYFQEKFEHL